jgi:hypothetical protein
MRLSDALSMALGRWAERTSVNGRGGAERSSVAWRESQADG